MIEGRWYYEDMTSAENPNTLGKFHLSKVLEDSFLRRYGRSPLWDFLCRRTMLVTAAGDKCTIWGRDYD